MGINDEFVDIALNRLSSKIIYKEDMIGLNFITKSNYRSPHDEINVIVRNREIAIESTLTKYYMDHVLLYIVRIDPILHDIENRSIMSKPIRDIDGIGIDSSLLFISNCLIQRIVLDID